MTMTRAFHRARIAVGTALLAVLVFLPFIRVNGESAFRFDVPTLRLFFFGSVIWMEDFFIVLVAVLALTFFTLFLTTAFGRIWCGWSCPQTILVDLTTFLDRSASKGIVRRLVSYLLALLAGMCIASSLIGYFVSPYEAMPLIRSGGTAGAVVTVSWAVLSLLLFLDLVLLRRTFCSTVCPYAKLQGVLFDDRTLIVAFDKNRRAECMRCAACVHACPVGIDIRKGTQSACIHCAECVDACTARMATCNRPSLIDYVFGEPGGRRRGLRVSLYLFGGLTALSALLFLYLVSTRVPFEATISPVYAGTATAAVDQSITNRYTLSLRNTGATDIAVSLDVSAPSVSARVLPASIRLARGQESIQVPIWITVHAVNAEGRRYLPLHLVVRHETINKELRKPVSFLLPDH